MPWTAADAACSSWSTDTAASPDDPLYKTRRTLHTGADLLTDRQIDKITALFADDHHVEVEATWGIYQH